MVINGNRNQGTAVASAPVKPPSGMRVSPLLEEAAHKTADEVYALLKTAATGLTQAEAEERLGQQGPNEVAQGKRHSWLSRLGMAARNPLVILLTILAVLSFSTGDVASGVVMMVMVLLGVSLRFVQETRADVAAAKLKAMIRVTATVIRDGQPLEIPLREIVPGDVVKLAAGDMIPADVRLVAAKDLFVVQSSLTGESLPVEKTDVVEPAGQRPPLELPNLCFLGTSVESGTARAVVVATGPHTYFGGMARSIMGQAVETSFDRGVKKFTWLMIRFMMVMVPLVFLINGLTKHNWKEAFFFSLAVAVGLTPEMLPMIVSVCLSKGAIMMSRKKVIVKRLNSIQNFGAMDVLCTDKTGTLTMDHVILERHCDVAREEDDNVLQMAYLISHFQTGLKNVLDRAILDYGKEQTAVSFENYRMVDEIPFDFSRRLMSVVVETPEGKRRILAKGAPEEIFRRCTQFELGDELYPMEEVIIDDLREEYEDLSSDGFRVLAVAYRDLDTRPAYSKADESELVLIGYVAFLDPPKDTATTAIAVLQKHGIAVKILTGDNHLVSRKICSEVGLPTDPLLLGAQVEKMTDAELAEAAEKTTLFARLSPAHKQRIIKALQGKGHVVGFLGDGINDAPALRAADVGVSVDTAVDIAKESADVILLEKSLMVLEEGVLEGRKVFVNILRYIRMGASSNFGNMFSVLGASCVPAVYADGANPGVDQQPAVRFFTGANPDRQRRAGLDCQAAAVGDWSDRALHHLHRPDQFDLRLHDLFHDVLVVQMQTVQPGCAGRDRGPLCQSGGLGPHLRRRAVPDRLVRGIVDDPDADHPRHPHQQDSVPARPGQLAADRDDRGDHVPGRVVAVFTAGRPARVRGIAGIVLAAADTDAALLHGAHPSHQDVAVAQGLDLICVTAFRGKGRGRGLGPRPLFVGWRGEAPSTRYGVV